MYNGAGQRNIIYSTNNNGNRTILINMTIELYKYKSVGFYISKEHKNTIHILSLFKRRLVAVSLLFTVNGQEYDGYNNTTN